MSGNIVISENKGSTQRLESAKNDTLASNLTTVPPIFLLPSNPSYLQQNQESTLSTGGHVCLYSVPKA